MNSKLRLMLANYNVCVASHIFATGPALELEQYIFHRAKSLLFIGHPFPFRKEVNSFFRLYRAGKLFNEAKAYPWKLPGAALYFKDFLYTLLWALFFKGKIDLFIGSDNFLAFIGLILKKLGKVKDVILYTIDYMPRRFPNPMLNYLYHYFDKKCLEKCLVVWNVSTEIAKARKKSSGFKGAVSAPQIVVPLGTWFDRIRKFSAEKKDKNTIIFMGHILEKQGLGVVIKAIPDIKRKIPLIKLIIIGTGSYEENLKNMVRRLNLTRNVKFLGYIEKHEDVERILATSTVAVATYKPDPNSFTFYADPGKIKNYLASGLPVILTDVPRIAKTIRRRECGLIASYNKDDVADKIIQLLLNRAMLKTYSENSIKFARRFDWNDIFSNALSKSLS